MMFGSGDEFDYFECSSCGCIQIETIPPDLSRYYPERYYSFSASVGAAPPSPLRAWLRRRRNSALVRDGGGFGRWLAGRFPEPNLANLGALRLRPGDRILDVGCGSGHLLHALRDLGFRRLFGIDAFLPAEQDLPGLSIRRGSIADLPESFDAILFHHSFEHVPDPVTTLEQARDRLAPGGVCLLRIPTVSSYAWQHYGVDWVQFDAPRHLHLLSAESVRRVADRVGFVVHEWKDVSTAFQFWGSEQYRRGIALESDRSYSKNPGGSVFTKSQIRDFARRAEVLNRERKGDEIAVSLRRAG